MLAHDLGERRRHVLQAVIAVAYASPGTVSPDESHLQYLVRRLVDGIVVWASPPRRRPLDAESIEHLVYLRVAELGTSVRAEHLDVGYRELERRERSPHQVDILTRPRGMPHYLAVVEIDQQADVLPASADAHVGQVAAHVGAWRSAGGYAGPRQRGLYLARAVAAVAGIVRCGHVALDGVGRFRALSVEAHRVVGGARNA